MDILQNVALAVLTGAVSTLCTVAVLRNDVKWIKETLSAHIQQDEKRFDHYETRLERYNG